MRKNKQIVKRGSKALEMSMRDVLDGLEEAVNYVQYHSTTESIQIISIDRPHADFHKRSQRSSNIYSVTNPPLHRSIDVVSYLIEREEHQNSLRSA